MKTFAFVVFLSCFGIVLKNDPQPAILKDVCVSSEEQKLFDLIMAYRKEKGLSPIPLSSKLSLVAQTHVRDLTNNYKFSTNNKCNPHSWSSKGKWSPCCYTPDHKKAKCMWDKPNEIAGYQSQGYEIAYYNSGNATAGEALEGWKRSPAHNPLLVNEGTWKNIEWKAIGVAIHEHYSVVWFGNLADEESPAVCR